MGDRPSQALNISQQWLFLVDQSHCGLVTARTSTVSGLSQKPVHISRISRSDDFGQLQLLDDTVTGITLSLTEQSQTSIMIRDGHQNPANFFIAVVHQMCCNIAEDPDSDSRAGTRSTTYI
jgi:hypothetical protein